jgi:hypothetical protein
MSVWEKVFKNTRSKVVMSLGPTSIKVPDITLPKRNQQIPSLFLGLALGTTYSKKTFFYQAGTEVTHWSPENLIEKLDLAVFRVEKVLSDTEYEISQGEESLSNFVSDRSDPPCTLFFQPIRFLTGGTPGATFVSTYEGQKVHYQSPTSKYIYQNYLRSQLLFLWKKAQSISQIKRFQIGQITMEYPDYFANPDVKKLKDWTLEVAKELFPPSLSSDDEEGDLSERFILLPESAITWLHWLTDNVETKLASKDLELKKMLVRYGILPRLADSVNFLVVTMGATHSRVVKLALPSTETFASERHGGETVNIGHTYLGRTGFGGDHISCAFLEEEEERRFGSTPVQKVSTFTRKVFEDWNKLNAADGKKHFESALKDQFTKAVEKLGDLTIKGFTENPENTVVVLGGKVFEIPYLREKFVDYLKNNRVPGARIAWPSSEKMGIERLCEIIHYHQKGMGRLFSVRSGVESESGQRFVWKIGKIVNSNLVDSVLEPDNKRWDAEHPREFTIEFGKGIKRVSLGYQAAGSGISQMWGNVILLKRLANPVQVTFRTSAPDDLKIIKTQTSDPKVAVVPEDFQIEMLIGGESPSHFPLHDKLLK